MAYASSRINRFTPALLVSLVLFFSGLQARTASNDNSIEWNGVYSDQSFRNPVFPMSAQAFTVELRVFKGDITAARVRMYDGEVRHQDMVWVRNSGSNGQYDNWQATIPPSTSPFLYYRFEISDGSDTDYYNRLGMFGDPPGHGDFLLNLSPLGAYPMGATPDGSGTVFRVWAPHAESVHVAGDFNGWNATATALTNVAGTWQTRVEGAGHNQEYRYVIENEGTHWRTDPYARRHTSSVGNSVIWNPERYAWQDQDWVTPYFEDMILYELHVGTFSGEGDGAPVHPSRFRDVVDRHLDHLVQLGVNTVELMPLNEFAGDLSWGYNPVSQYAVESVYGSPDDLKYLVDRCHQAGLAVILDVVFNHMGASDLAGNLMDFDGNEIYFYPPGNGFRDTPWGPRPDYGIREVREYLAHTMRYWIQEYHMDGFRLDGSDFIKINTDGWQLLRDLKEITDQTSLKAILTAEQLPNDPAVTRSVSQEGAGLDSQWNDAFHDALRAALEESAFGDPDMNRLAEGMNHFDFGGVKAVNYIESHDEVAVHGRVTSVADQGNPHSVWAYGRGKLCFGMVMFTAGIPMILQGQEFMEDRGFGDAREHRIQWNYKTLYPDYYLACRDMTWLRRRSPALRASSSQNVYHLNESANVVAWHRWNGPDEDLIVVANFSNANLDNYCLGLPLSGNWLEALNTDAAVYGGDNAGNGGSINAGGDPLHGMPHSACVTLPRMSVLVLSRQAIDLTPDPDADNDGMDDDWEREYQLNPNNPMDALRDQDRDGMTNLEEFKAGTHPRSGSSRLHIMGARMNESGQITMEWDTASGRIYRVLASESLDPEIWTVQETLEGDGGPASFTDPAPAAGRTRFYLIEVVTP